MTLPLDKNLWALLEEIRALAPEEKVYLVGGAVRDLLLGREVTDLDFVMKDGSVRLAKAVKKHFGGVWYSLDDEHQTARVLLNQGRPQQQIFDFTAFIGDDLEEDLRQRDFSVNAMAIDLDDLEELIDPLGGEQDLLEGQLRLSNPESLQSDPLRVLRGVRLIRSHKLNFDPELIQSMRVATKGLSAISGERIRDELLKCLALPDLASSYQLMEEFGIYDALSTMLYEACNKTNRLIDSNQDSPAQTHSSQDFSSRMEYFLNSFEQILRKIFFQSLESESKEAYRAQLPHVFDLQRVLNEKLQADRSRSQLLKLVAFFSDVIPTENLVDALTQTFLLGQKEAKHIDRILIGWGGIPGLAELESIEGLDLYRFFKPIGSAALEAAILQIASADSVNIEETANLVIRTWFEQQNRTINPLRLVDGETLQKKLGISPGPVLGEALESIREAQVQGTVTTPQDALEFVRTLLNKKENNENKSK